MSRAQITFQKGIGYKRRTSYENGSLEEEEYSLSIGETVGVWVTGTSKLVDKYEYRAYLKTSDYDLILQDLAVTLNSLTVSGEMTGIGTTDPLSVRVHAASDPNSADAETGFDACASGNYVTVGAGGEFEAVFTDTLDILRILNNGVTFSPVWNKSSIEKADAMYEVYVSAAEVDYINPSEAPIVGNLSAVSSAGMSSAIPYSDNTSISWEYSNGSGVVQSAVDIQIRVDGGEWVDVALRYATTAQTYLVPASVYPMLAGTAGVMYYRVRAYSQNDVVSEWAESSVPLVFPAVYDLVPRDAAEKLGSEPIRLSWRVRCVHEESELQMADPPASYDVQYSINSGELWMNLLVNHTAQSSNNVYYYTVPVGILTAGVIFWRVRPRVSGNKLDVWTQESFLVRVQASTSSVNCDGKPHPTVSWVPSSQIAYQVRFADYDSGAVYGTATSHRIPYFYADGAYPVQVRTQADDGKWSAWTEPEYVTIRNTSPAGSLMLTAQKTRHAVALEWSGTVFGRYILYRNGIPVYIGSETRYTDRGAHGECTYFVRGIADPNYLQSNSVSVNGSPATDCMYDLTTQKWIPLRYSAAPRSRAYSETANAVYKYYAGRKYPVAYLDGTADRQLNVAYCFKTMADADAVREALGHPVIYKDTRGRRIIGIFGPVTETVEGRMVLHTLNIVQVDYKEEVRYET